MKFYGDDLEPGRLLLHRDMLIDIVKQHNTAPLHIPQRSADIFGWQSSAPEESFAGNGEVNQNSVHQSCTYERSFSCLRPLKIYIIDDEADSTESPGASSLTKSSPAK